MNERHRILLIAPLFFDYYKRMMEELRNYGDVDFLSMEDAVYGRKKGDLDEWFDIAIKNNRKYSFVLIISGGALSLDFLGKMRLFFKDAFWIHYNWDDVASIPAVEERYSYFDKCFTYSKYDAFKNNKIEYLPFFFTNEFVSEKVYDISFIGTFHTDRLEIGRAVV